MEEHSEYDGLIFFTDGYADVPELHKRSVRHKILWFLCGEEEYKDNNEDLRKLGRVCYLHQ